MKKFIVTILAVFYLGVSSGATVHFHYCMGQLIEWGLASQKAPKCSKCGMESGFTKNCCKHQSKEVKVDAAQKVSETSLQFKVPNFDLDNSLFTPYSEIYYSSLVEEFPIANAPPQGEAVSTFIRNCTFRI